MAGMMRFFRGFVLLTVCAGMGLADVSKCHCDPKDAESMKARECSLCLEADKHPADEPFFVVKDSSPRKPNRWLVLPRAHDDGPHPLHELPKKTRDELWAYAIQVGREKFGDDWALAYNGMSVRTQCHLHIHVGKWIPAADTVKFKFVKHIQDFPAPEDSGILIRPTKGGYLVLTGEQIMETALVR